MLVLALLSVLLPPAAQSGPAPPPIPQVEATQAPPLRLKHLRTKARLELMLFDAQGRLRRSALAELRAFLTDPRTSIDHPIHWRLATLLVATAAAYPGKHLEVVSGYRHKNKHHKRSKHTRGRAIDFRVEGVPNRVLFERVRKSFADVGVGYYPNSTFIHLDVRERSAIWVDYSGPGQTPCYSRTPHQDLASGFADRQSYEAAQASGCRKPRGR